MDSTRPTIGQRTWAIAEGFIPGRSTGPDDMESHETVCVLNTSDQDANVNVMIYFSDREPAGPYLIRVPARRTVHQWISKLSEPEPVPTDTDYAMLLHSDVPVVVQHSRLDSREPANALLSTLAFPVAD
jgi:hypothetical protein